MDIFIQFYCTCTIFCILMLVIATVLVLQLHYCYCCYEALAIDVAGVLRGSIVDGLSAFLCCVTFNVLK